MKKYLNLALLISVTAGLVLSACGNEQDASQGGHSQVVDLGQFGDYVAQFQQQGADQGYSVDIKDLIVKFGAMSNPLERGYCETGSDMTPTIVVDETYWDQADEGARQSLLFHELGHCVLDRLHLSGVTTDGAPLSVMNPYTIPANVYDYNHDYYMHELFSVHGQF